MNSVNMNWKLVVLVLDNRLRWLSLNHPLAGETLYFKGEVLENREATEDEINHLMKHLTGGCGGGCASCNHDCESDCDHEHNHEGGCGCGHCH